MAWRRRCKRQLHENAFGGNVFVFRGRRGDRVKLLWWDGQGLCFVRQATGASKFVWPQASSGAVSLTSAQLSMLLEGIDWRRPVRSWQPTMSA